MKLLPSHLVAQAGGHEHGEEYGHHTHDHGAHEHLDHSHERHDHAAADGIEWEDDMVEINRLTTPANMRWKLIDKAEPSNAAIDWRFQVGDEVKIQLLKALDGPMYQPPLPRPRAAACRCNGLWSPTWSGKTPCSSATGETVDILLDVTNPGLWMARHIAEHHESGMMFSFNVTP